MNLFEEIEFFKELNVSFFTPFLLTNFYVPSFIIQLLPFIIFVSSMWFLLKIRNNKDMLILKVFGFSNFKIFLILSLSSFLLGWLILFVFNPITSKMAKYYEITKSNYFFPSIGITFAALTSVLFLIPSIDSLKQKYSKSKQFKEESNELLFISEELKRRNEAQQKWQT